MKKLKKKFRKILKNLEKVKRRKIEIEGGKIE